MDFRVGLESLSLFGRGGGCVGVPVFAIQLVVLPPVSIQCSAKYCMIRSII